MVSTLPSSLSPGTLHLVTTPNNDSPSRWLAQLSPNTQKHRILVLDSSFNPPTLAHLALASLPPPLSTRPDRSDASGYTAHLLLFSLTNVEKKASASDPSLSQRIHLISLLLPYLPPNTAIGLINEPTFVGKSQTIHTYLSSTSPLESIPELSFVIGTDTLTRFFDPRFYTSTPGGMDEALGRFFEEEGSIVISARRGGEDERKIEEAVISRKEVKAWVDKGKLALAGTGEEDWVGMSSTKIRQAVQGGDWEAVGKLTVPEIAEYIKKEGLYNS